MLSPAAAIRRTSADNDPRRRALHRAIRVGLVALVAACSSDESSPEPAPEPGSDIGVSATDAGSVDAGAADADAPDGGFPDSGEPVVAELCRSLEMPSAPLRAAGSTFRFGDVAGDFTVNELDGRTWNMTEHWTGCESYVFITFINIPVRQIEEILWSSDVGDLVRTPVNSHFFFMSTESSMAARAARVQTMKERIEATIDRTYSDLTERADHKARFHYVTDDPSKISGSVGDFWNDYERFYLSPESIVQIDNRRRATSPLPYFFAIDRDQEWDSGGNPAESVGGPPALRMASYLPAFFNHKAAIRDQQAAETGVTTIELLEGTITDRVLDREVTLPSASEMAAFDTMEFDVTVNCPHRNVYACSEWDRIAFIDVCLDTECTSRRELVRWITPYWRRGERRWVMDASALLGLVAGGGGQRFRVTFGPTWERPTARDVRVTLRLSNQARGSRAVGAERAFTGGAFNNAYNDREPFRFTPPATATKVELVVILSGHGDQTEGEVTRCSEWCDHRHDFSVNGTPLERIRHSGFIFSPGGCGDASAQGVPPGQFGNWAQERAYWCPGLPVDHKRVDITALVRPGEENELSYAANYRGQPGRTGGGNISLSAYVAWYE